MTAVPAALAAAASLAALLASLRPAAGSVESAALAALLGLLALTPGLAARRSRGAARAVGLGAGLSGLLVCGLVLVAASVLVWRAWRHGGALTPPAGDVRPGPASSPASRR